MSGDCLFCRLQKNEKEILYDNSSFYSILDENPVTAGHSIIIAKQHVVSLFDLTEEEWEQLGDALKMVKNFLQKEYKPDAFNIGVNDGREAGRTIDHLHVHLIPRYNGDVKNCRGGVRNIIPGKGDY